MKCLIVYFSQHGTTQKVSEAITSGLYKAGYQVETHNLISGEPPNLSGIDLLGIGTPVYYFRPPINVTNFLANLPDLNGLPVFVFLLHGTYPFDAGSEIKNAILVKGATEAGSFQCYGSDIFLGYLKQGYLFSPDHPNQDEISKAEHFGYEIGSKVYRPIEVGNPPPFIYRLERFLTNQWFVRNVYSRLFISNKKCKMCGLCVNECPTKNISKDQNGRPRWGKNCLLCLTCELKCPQEAIVSPASWPVFFPFMRYNVRYASRDSKLQYTKVIHHKGKTKKI